MQRGADISAASSKRIDPQITPITPIQDRASATTHALRNLCNLCNLWIEFRESVDYSASFTTCTFTCAVTSLCNFTGTSNSPRCFSGSSNWIFRRSMV
jgi:hypothetical protein